MTSKPVDRVQSMLLMTMSFLLTSVTFLLGALPLRMLQTQTRPLLLAAVNGFVIAGFMAMGQWYFGFAQLTVYVLMASFGYFERNLKLSLFAASARAVLATIAVVSAALAVYFQFSPTGQLEVLRETIEVSLIKFMPPEQSSLAVERIMGQIPSLAVVLIMSSLAVSLVFEKPAAKAMRLMPSKRWTLKSFRTPDGFVWLFVASLLFGFLDMNQPQVQQIAMNVLNVVMACYFFQGLAVVSVAFEQMKTGRFWRAIWYTLLLFQFSIFVGLIGLMDYWWDFRQRLLKMDPKLSEK